MIENRTNDKSLAQLKADHFAALRPGSTVVFSNRKAIWKVAKVVERGAVMYRADDSSHQHLAEWHELVLAIIESH
jgi:tagatose-1,6-bisphosphate aldolase non-catalytic subunit AgaZ/GatZ